MAKWLFEFAIEDDGDPEPTPIVVEADDEAGAWEAWGEFDSAADMADDPHAWCTPAIGFPELVDDDMPVTPLPEPDSDDQDDDE